MSTIIRPLTQRASRTLAILALAAAALTIGVLGIGAQSGNDTPVPTLYGDDQLTRLIVQGTGIERVSYDGATISFTVSSLAESVRDAVSNGNAAQNQIAAAVERECISAPDSRFPDDACVSQHGLVTTSLRIQEEYDWIDGTRVSIGFRYSHSSEIGIVGTEAAGSLIDLIVSNGGDLVRFDNLQFTASESSAAYDRAQLNAIDDAQETAARIADHMGYEIVRIVTVSPPASSVFSRQAIEFAEADDDAMSDAASVPTEVTAGGTDITAQVELVLELRPIQ